MDINGRPTIEHLRAAVSLGATSSFTDSGALLDLSQSSLSRRIADLEQVLGVQLFHRTTRSVQPTAAGRELLPRMRAIVLNFDKGLEHIRDYADGAIGSITIGCLPSIAASYLPQFIREFTAAHPGIHIEVRDALTAQVLAQVRQGEVDFGIAAVSRHEPDLVYERLGADEFYCAVQPTHPLALESGGVPWTRLRGERLIAFSPSTSISEPVRTALAAAGVDAEPKTMGHNVGAIAGLVAAGMGITIVPSLVRPLMQFANLAFVPLLPTVQRELSIVRRRGEKESPAVQRFVAPLRAAGIG